MSATVDPRTPVLVGAGQQTFRGTSPIGPTAMMAEVARSAAADAGLAGAPFPSVDLMGVVGFTVDVSPEFPLPRVPDPPAALAEALGIAPRRSVYTHMGGNTPQSLVGWAADAIAAGEADTVLLAGAEFLGSLMATARSGGDLSVFGAGPKGRPERWGDPRHGCTPQEAAHGLDLPVHVYPMFENALRAHLGRSVEAHQREIAALFSRFSEAAARNPSSWFPIARSAEEIAAPGPDNRMIAFPYPKYMNAVIQVDQAAAVLMTSSARADALGVPIERRVYVHGSADAHELWNPLDRVNYWSAPAIGACARAALAQAELDLGGVDVFDIYSCFPSAVEIACAEIGLALDDPRGLTVTGGLPYFGGPGNNYSMHAIAEMMGRLRARPGSFGMVTANGWFLTKHAIGIYSTQTPRTPWRRPDPKAPQRVVDALRGPPIVLEPSGAATIETYTVAHGRAGPARGIVIGRDEAGRRFVANTPADEATLRDLESREAVGRPGRVDSFDGGMRNVFTPA